MRRRLCLGSAALLGCLALLPATSQATGAQASRSAATPLKIGLMLTGPANDGGYYEQVTRGVRAAAKKIGAQVNLVESVAFDTQAQINVLKNLAKEGNKLIIVDGSEGDSAAAVAPQFPDIEFVIHTAPPPKPFPNLHAYLPEHGVTSYIAGVLAAKLTKSGKVAFVGGFDDVPTGQSSAGYKLGVQSVKPAPKYLSTIVGDYSDPAKGKQATAAQIANGADVVYVYLDAGFLGAIQAAKESGKAVLLISQTVERCHLGDFIVGSALIDNPIIFDEVVRDYKRGTLPKGTKFYSVDQPKITRMTLCPKFATPQNRQVVRSTTRAIVQGKIKLPSSVTGE